MNLNTWRSLLTVCILMLFASSSFSTDGYFVTEYGAKQRGGAGVALPSDSLAGATNPAGLVLVGNGFDAVLTLFRPTRSATITGNQLPPAYPDANGTYDASRVKNFFIPELGYSHLIGPKIVAGVPVFGNRGLDTSYTTAIPCIHYAAGGTIFALLGTWTYGWLRPKLPH